MCGCWLCIFRGERWIDTQVARLHCFFHFPLSELHRRWRGEENKGGVAWSVWSFFFCCWAFFVGGAHMLDDTISGNNLLGARNERAFFWNGRK